jgi:cytochrome d ubiquinol oxidase subunit I
MIGLGMYFIALTLLGLFLLYKNLLYKNTLFLKLTILSGILPFLTMQMGWMAAEVGRQPWIVYNLMKTTDGISVVTSAEQVLFSIILFSLIFLCILFLVIYLIKNEIVKQTASL